MQQRTLLKQHSLEKQKNNTVSRLPLSGYKKMTFTKCRWFIVHFKPNKGYPTSDKTMIFTNYYYFIFNKLYKYFTTFKTWGPFEQYSVTEKFVYLIIIILNI